MLTRHGSPMIVLAAFLAIAAGCAGYFFSGGSLWVTLAAAAAILFLFSLAANLYGARREGRLPLPNVPTAPAPRLAVVAATQRPSHSLIRSAFFYLAVGVLLVIWSAVGAWYMWRHGPQPDGYWYACAGLILTGFVFVAVGAGMAGYRHRLRHRGEKSFAP